MKKFRKITYVILILIIIVLSFTIYTNANKDNSKNEGDKTISEIKFIESKLVDLLNKMNGIETRNYKYLLEKRLQKLVKKQVIKDLLIQVIVLKTK